MTTRSTPLSSDWRWLLRQPIATGLALSLCLHLALLALVQPVPGGGGMGALVIQARLTPPEPELETTVVAPELLPEAPPEVPPEVPPEPIPKPVVETEAKPPVEPTRTAEHLLTSHVPSPAPPLPLPPVPVPAAAASEPAPAAVAPPASVPVTAAAGTPARHETSAPLGVGIDTNWYFARQVDTRARETGRIVPEYPESARRRNQEGTLKLMVKIDDLGRVRDVEVVEADYPGVFDEAALEAFREARFHPAMKDGRPVRYQAYIRVVFKLRD
ncbi:MAG: TonB family protein [Pseudomonadota bacterium]|nr:TonB family protein [Pseudomonadota bacterium]MDP1902837.1 TonB family protein [Pseudomonadota bacterium]